MYLDKEEVYEIYCKNVSSDEDFKQLIEELNKIHELKKVERLHNYKPLDEFYLKSYSWQVEEAKANGRYVYVKDYSDIKETSKDHYSYKYLYRHEDSGRLFLVENETLNYLNIYKDYQDYKFIYIGVCGDYPIITI